MFTAVVFFVFSLVDFTDVCLRRYTLLYSLYIVGVNRTFGWLWAL